MSWDITNDRSKLFHFCWYPRKNLSLKLIHRNFIVYVEMTPSINFQLRERKNFFFSIFSPLFRTFFVSSVYFFSTLRKGERYALKFSEKYHKKKLEKHLGNLVRWYLICMSTFSFTAFKFKVPRFLWIWLKLCFFIRKRKIYWMRSTHSKTA